MSEELKTRIQNFSESEENCSNLTNTIISEFFSDDCSYEEAGEQICQAILENDTNALLIAICGYGIDSLLSKCGA